jgi:hypothetical protein
MRILKYLLSFVIILVFTASIYSQSKKSSGEDEEDLSYGGMGEPGYVTANVSLVFGGLKGKYALRTTTLQGKATDYYLPEIDVEVGIVNRLSLELAIGYEKIVASANLNLPKIGKQRTYDKTVDGLSPILLGANVGILKENKLCPAMYMQNLFSIPKTGYTNFQNEQLGYYTALSCENTLSDVTYLDYSVTAGWDGNTPYPFFGFVFNPNFSVTDNISAYSDFSGFYGKDMNAIYTLDIGSTITFTEVFSLDLMLGTSFQKNSTAKTAYGGLQFTFGFDAFAK